MALTTTMFCTVEKIMEPKLSFPLNTSTSPLLVYNIPAVLEYSVFVPFFRSSHFLGSIRLSGSVSNMGKPQEGFLTSAPKASFPSPLAVTSPCFILLNYMYHYRKQAFSPASRRVKYPRHTSFLVARVSG